MPAQQSLHRSRGGVEPTSPRHRGHRHRVQRLIWQRYHYASINLPRGLRWRGVPKQTSFCRSHPGTRTSKRKIYRGADLRTQSWCPIITFRAHEEELHGAPSPKIHHEIPERVRSSQICRSRGAHQGGSLRRHLENPYLWPRREPGGIRKPPNSNQELIPNPHQLGGGGKRCGMIWAH